MQKIISLACPGCGVHVSTGQKRCEYCGGPIIIATFESLRSMSTQEVNKYVGAYRKILAENPDSQELNTSIAMCFLKLKLYDKAIPAFEKAMDDNFDNPEVFFYAAVSRLHGQKAFVAQRADVDKTVEYLHAAIMVEDKGIYHYFLSYIKYDYFHRKYLNISPNYIDEYDTAVAIGVSDDEIRKLFSTLDIEKPEAM